MQEEMAVSIETGQVAAIDTWSQFAAFLGFYMAIMDKDMYQLRLHSIWLCYFELMAFIS